MNPSGNACLSKVWMQRPDVWIYIFECVIRLGNVKQLALLQGFTCRSSSVCWTAAREAWESTFFAYVSRVGRLKLRQPSFSALLESVTELSRSMHHGSIYRQVHDFRCGLSFFLWSLVRFNCARNSRVDDVSCLWGWLEYRGPWAWSRILHGMWMHLHQLVPHGSIISCVLASSSLQVGWVLRVLR